MKSTEIIVFAAVFAFLGFRLYQKYVKKDAEKAGMANKTGKSSSFPSHEKENDYEPYSKK